MKEKRKKVIWKSVIIFKEIFKMFSLIIFEVVNIVTGDWINPETSKLDITTGKFITLLIGTICIVINIYDYIKDRNSKIKNKNLSKENILLKKMINKYEQLINLTCNGATEGIKEFDNVNIREIDILKNMTFFCQTIYELLIKIFSNDKNITVNIYHKFKVGKRLHSRMVAHEGITKPRNLFKDRILNGKDKYYCEEIMLKENPEHIILLDPLEVSNRFNLKADKCKYKQYIAIPIVDLDTKFRFLLEINILDECILEDDKNNIIDIIETYIMPFIEILVFLMETEKYANVVTNSLNKGGNANE